MTSSPNIVLINPNTDHRATSIMLAAARAAATDNFSIAAITAKVGVPMIVDELELAEAARTTLLLASELVDVSGIIVAAFGDPGVTELRDLLQIPIIGIGEASLRLAASGR